MTVTDFIATLALVAAIASLTYTIIVDRRKPRLRVWGKVSHIIEHHVQGAQQHGPYFHITATNIGPGRVRVQGVGLPHRSYLRRWYRKVVKNDITQGAVLFALDELSDSLPKWLEVGESLDLLYPPNSDMLKEDKMFDCFYVYDMLGSWHWAEKGVFVEARESLATPDPLDTD